MRVLVKESEYCFLKKVCSVPGTNASFEQGASLCINPAFVTSMARNLPLRPFFARMICQREECVSDMKQNCLSGDVWQGWVLPRKVLRDIDIVAPFFLEINRCLAFLAVHWRMFWSWRLRLPFYSRAPLFKVGLNFITKLKMAVKQCFNMYKHVINKYK